MKKQRTLPGCWLILLALSAQAQEIMPDVSTTSKPKSYESTATYRLGRQGVSLGSLNQVLEQTGYRSLSNQFTMFGVASEVKRTGCPLTLITQFDVALNAENQARTNGTNTVRASFLQWGLGAGYRIVGTDKFTLTPKLLLSPTLFHLNVTRNNTPAPSLTAALANPGSQQTANFASISIAGDLGLSGQYRFVYKATTSQTDCGPLVRERSFVVGFDAGYRLSSEGRFNQSMNDADNNPGVNLSGWYVAARLGFGNRYIR